MVQADRLSRLKGSSSDHDLPRGSFAELVPSPSGRDRASLALAGVRNIAELTANTDRLVEAGNLAPHLGGPAFGPAARRGGLRPCGGDSWAVTPDLRSAGKPLGPRCPQRWRRFGGQRQAGGHGAPRQHARQVYSGGPTSLGSEPGAAWRLRARSPPGPSRPGRWR